MKRPVLKLALALMLALPAGTLAADGVEVKPVEKLLSSVQAQWKKNATLPQEVNTWFFRLARKDYAGAAHLWSSIKAQIPSSFESAATAGHLYALWKLELPQTFTREWISALSNRKFRDSESAAALDAEMGDAYHRYILSYPVSISGEQVKTLRRALVANSRRGQYLTLMAWASLRNSVIAEEVLVRLLPRHPLYPHVLKAAVAGRVKRNDLKGARELLSKTQKSLESNKGARAELLPYVYLQMGRLLFQWGDMEGAEKMYLSVPEASPSYLRAREELLWVYLHKGEIPRLRGDLTMFGGKIFAQDFTPEVGVVRAISDLKLCYYDQVTRDIDDFVSSNRSSAKQITKELSGESSGRPPQPDFYTLKAEKLMRLHKAEHERLIGLSRAAFLGPLPVVGGQEHWRRYTDEEAALAREAESDLKEEYRRQWKYREAALSEASRKMQFVRLELMNQVKGLTTNLGELTDKEKDIEETRFLDQAEQNQRKTFEGSAEAQQVFPFDGVVWPDEIGKYRAVAETLCLKKLNDSKKEAE